MMVGTLIVANEFGGYGAKGALEALDKSGKWAQGKLGRGTVRASGISNLDNKFKESDFGNTRFGRGLRSVTTGLVTKQKFGSKDSVSSIDKKSKKEDEASAKQIEENAEARGRNKAESDAKNESLHSQRLMKTKALLATQKDALKLYIDTATTPGVPPEHTRVYTAKAKEAQREIDELTKEETVHESRLARAKAGGRATDEEIKSSIDAEKLKILAKMTSEMSGKRKFASRIGGMMTGAAIGGAVGGPPGVLVGGFWGTLAGQHAHTSSSYRKAVADKMRGGGKSKDSRGKKKEGDLDDMIERLDDLDADEREKLAKAATKKD